MTIGANGVDVVQFSVHGGGSGGKGTSPAFAVVDRHRANRETAISFFIGIPRSVNVVTARSIPP